MMHDLSPIECPAAYVLPNGVRILLAREEYPRTDVDTPLLDRLTPDGRTHRTRLVEMRRDLERLHAGWFPDERDLADVPRLAAWRSVGAFGARLPSLFGFIRDHPALAGPTVLTSAVVAYDGAGFTWARTISRFYRLDRPFGVKHH